MRTAAIALLGLILGAFAGHASAWVIVAPGVAVDVENMTFGPKNENRAVFAWVRLFNPRAPDQWTQAFQEFDCASNRYRVFYVFGDSGTFTRPPAIQWLQTFEGSKGRYGLDFACGRFTPDTQPSARPPL